jgi:cytoskeletal protein CcmA (bactofilin family)
MVRRSITIKSPTSGNDFLNALNQHITRIGADCRIVGSMSLANDALFLGQISGRLEVTGCLDAPASAKIEGTLIVGELRLSGIVEGDVLATRSVHLHAGSKLSGRLFTPRLTCDANVTIDANIHVGPEALKQGSAELNIAENAVTPRRSPVETSPTDQPSTQPHSLAQQHAESPAQQHANSPTSADRPEQPLSERSAAAPVRRLDEPAPIQLTGDPDALTCESEREAVAQPAHDMSVALAHALRDTPQPRVVRVPPVSSPSMSLPPVTLPLAVTSFLHRSRAPKSHPLATPLAAGASIEQPSQPHDPQTPSRPAHLPPDLSP